MLFASRHRFHPRHQQDRERDRTMVALRAQLADLAERLHAIEREQQTQLKRIAQLQAQLDEAVQWIKSFKH